MMNEDLQKQEKIEKEMIEKSTLLVNEILEDGEMRLTSEKIEEFLKEKTIIYNDELTVSQISKLKDIKSNISSKIKSVIILFIASKNIKLGEIQTALDDIRTNLENDEMDLLYDLKYDEEITETKTKILMAI